MREKHVHRLVARSAVQEKPALGYVFYVFVEMIEKFDGYFHPTHDEVELRNGKSDDRIDLVPGRQQALVGFGKLVLHFFYGF